MAREHGSFERGAGVLRALRAIPGTVGQNTAGRAPALAFALTLPLASCAVAGCADVVVDAGTGGGTTTGTTTSSTSSTASTTSTTDTTSTTTTTATKTCNCAEDPDCPAGMLCQQCVCLPECEVVNCPCEPGVEVPCYSGPPGTQNVGLCKQGIQTCTLPAGWGPCVGEVLPAPEACNGVDDDCDGAVDPQDQDGDGWTACQGDCCESVACADHPEEVNPGAQEIPGDGVDNDCNPATLDGAPAPDCTGPALQTPTSAVALVKAMDLCQLTSESPPLPQKTWGVISAHLSLANGDEAGLKDVQAGVLADYGPNVLPKAGATMAALSSGTARDEADPGFVYPQNGYMAGQTGNFLAGTQVPIPPDFLGPNGGKVPAPCGSCGDPECAQAFDSASLKLRIRVPTNAYGFALDAKFYSAEYPENVCSEYDDFFVALLTSQAPGLPADRNVAFDKNGFPFSVDNLLFDECAYADKCPLGSLELVGTGMGGWDGVLLDGAATSWQTIEAPVVPGETIELQLAIWDAIDGNVDSLVLLDRFRWLPKGSPQPIK